MLPDRFEARRVVQVSMTLSATAMMIPLLLVRSKSAAFAATGGVLLASTAFLARSRRFPTERPLNEIPQPFRGFVENQATKSGASCAKKAAPGPAGPPPGPAGPPPNPARPRTRDVQIECAPSRAPRPGVPPGEV